MHLCSPSNKSLLLCFICALQNDLQAFTLLINLPTDMSSLIAVLAIVLVGLLYGFFIAIICGQRISERHYHVLAKKELTKVLHLLLRHRHADDAFTFAIFCLCLVPSTLKFMPCPFHLK